MKQMKSAKWGGWLLTIFLVTACSKKDVDKISGAQACLDNSTQSTALSCMDQVAGMDTQAANLIRCGATFAFQGFGSPATLASVANQLSSNSTSDTSSVLSVVAFTKDVDVNTNYNDAVDNFNYCVASGSKGLVFLSALARIGSAALKCGGATITLQLTCLATSSLRADLGSVIRVTQQMNCQGGSSMSAGFCTQFNQAVTNAGSNGDTSIFNCFLNQYVGAAPCP